MNNPRTFSCNDRPASPPAAAQRASSLATLLVSAVVLFSSHAAQSQPSPLLNGDAPPDVHGALRSAETARMLKLQEQVEVRGLSRTNIRDEFLEMFKSDLDAVVVDGVERVAHFLELLHPEEQLLEVYLNMMQEEVLGYFRPDRRELVLVELGDSASFTEMASYHMTVVHELVHALQDDAFDLEAYRMHDIAVGDTASARVAVVEGDAVYHMNANADPSDPVAAAQAATMQLTLRRPRGAWRTAMRASNLEHNPFIYRSVLFPYIFGMPFIAAVHGQRGLHGVNALFDETIPLSTEQILHPDRFLDGDQPTWLEAELREGFCSDSRSVTVNGDFELRNLLSALANMDVFDDYIDVAIDGWDGDRMEFWTGCGHARRGEALSLVSVWDSVGDAQEFADAASRVFALWLYPQYSEATSDDAVLHTDERASDDGTSSYTLQRVGDRILVVDQWHDQVSVLLLSRTNTDDAEVERLVGELALSIRRYGYPNVLTGRR